MSRISVIVIALLFSILNLEAQSEKTISKVHGLKVGATALMFTAIDSDRIEFTLATELKNGTVVLIFYRGFWCPVCNKHLESIQDILKMIEKTGHLYRKY